ncbi:cutinase family protein [Leifsonia sp. 2MCAF36]|uniref:cutinase family protein n=1 Tax=Leifsonia sp. 2MCAF36 TaxID=3232988 RepID=UPI003F968743
MSAIVLSVVLVLVGVGISRPASAAECADVEVVGARGSGDPYLGEQFGLGPALFRAVGQLTEIVQASNHTIHAYGVKYPAIGIDLLSPATGAVAPGKLSHLFAQPYDNSRDKGTAMILAKLDEVRTSCPASQIVLAGYSQGADALGKAVDQMTIAQKNSIRTVLLFGDTYFNPADDQADFSGFRHDHSGVFGTRGLWSAELPFTPVISYCHFGDPICNGSAGLSWDLPQFAVFGMAQHLNYADDSASAARKVASHLDLASIGQPVSTPIPRVVQASEDQHTYTTFVLPTGGMTETQRDSAAAHAFSIARKIEAAAPDGVTPLFRIFDAYNDDGAYDTTHMWNLNRSAYVTAAVLPSAFTPPDFQTGDWFGDYPEYHGQVAPSYLYRSLFDVMPSDWTPQPDDAVSKFVLLTDQAPIDGNDRLAEMVDNAQRQGFRAYGVDLADGATTGLIDGLNAMTQATGGLTVTGPVAQIDDLAAAALTEATPQPAIGGPTSLAVNEQGTYTATNLADESSDPVLEYKWNFGDGTPVGQWDQVTTSPTTTHTFPDYHYGWDVTVEAVTASGVGGVTRYRTNVDRPAITAPPATPAAPSVAPNSTGGTLTLPAASGATSYTVKDENGDVVSAFIPQDYYAPTVSVSIDSSDGQTHSYTITASNSVGSSTSAPVTVTPQPTDEVSTQGDLTIGDPGSVTGNGGRIRVGGNFTCTGNAHVDGDVTVTGTVHLSETCVIAGSVTTSSDLEMSGSAQIIGNVASGGNITIAPTTLIGGSVDATGSITGTNGETISELQDANALIGTITTGTPAPTIGAVTFQTIGFSATDWPTSTPTTWKDLINGIAESNGLPDTSPGRSATPGCTIAPTTSSVGAASWQVTTNTVVDATTAGSGCPTVTVDNMNIGLSADLTLIVDNIQQANSVSVYSADGQPHRLRILATGTSASTGGIAIDSLQGSDQIETRLHAPTVSVSTSLDIRGSIEAADQVDLIKTKLAFNPLP